MTHIEFAYGDVINIADLDSNDLEHENPYSYSGQGTLGAKGSMVYLVYYGPNVNFSKERFSINY